MTLHNVACEPLNQYCKKQKIVILDTTALVQLGKF